MDNHEVAENIALGVTRKPDETWRQTVARVAGREGLAEECLEIYDRLVKDHPEEGEAEAAWCALCEWDCLELA